MVLSIQNQSGGDPTREQMFEVYTRIIAAPSEWHGDLREYFERVSQAIFSWYQSKSNANGTGSGMYSEFLSGDVTGSILRRAKVELGSLGHAPQFNEGEGITDDDRTPSREFQLVLFGLLDFLSQLVSTFPASKGITDGAEKLALSIITTSNLRELRFKAVSIPVPYNFILYLTVHI